MLNKTKSTDFQTHAFALQTRLLLRPPVQPQPPQNSPHLPAFHLLSRLLSNSIIPLNALNPPRITRPGVQVHARVIVVVRPGSQQVSSADAAVAGLAAVEIPGPGGEVDRVGSVVHGYVDVVVAFVLVGGGALGAGWGVSGM